MMALKASYVNSCRIPNGFLQSFVCIFQTKEESNTLYKLKKRRYLPHYWSDKGFKGTVVNRADPSVNGESEIQKNYHLTGRTTREAFPNLIYGNLSDI